MPDTFQVYGSYTLFSVSLVSFKSCLHNHVAYLASWWGAVSIYVNLPKSRPPRPSRFSEYLTHSGAELATYWFAQDTDRDNTGLPKIHRERRPRCVRGGRRWGGWHSQNLLAGEKGETKVWRWFKKQLGPIYGREIFLESPGFYTTLHWTKSTNHPIGSSEKKYSRE